MARLFALVGRFGRDESGVFAVVFGLMAIVLVALSGAVVDYVALEQARSRSQIALDAAVLALQQDMLDGVSDNVIKSEAVALIIDRIANQSITIKNVNIASDVAEGTLYIDAQINVPTFFVSLVGVYSLSAIIRSEAVRRKTILEVVMVLDNSGSMNDNFENRNEKRMTSLVNAAKSATEILYAQSSPQEPNVKLAIVPFTQYVNVGPEHANQPWLNRAGNNPIMRDNFDDDANLSTAFTSTNPAFDRINLFGQLQGGYSWAGCVEARQTPYDTNATPPTTPETRFVPLFAPDEPDTGEFTNNYLSDVGGKCSAAAEPTCTAVNKYSTINKNNVLSGLQSTTYTLKTAAGVTTTVTSCPAAYNPWLQSSRTQNNSEKTITVVNYSNRVRQERICKYVGGKVTKASRSGATGPNVDCPIHPLVPLTYSESTVLAAIEKMRPKGASNNQPEGGTNIAQGAVWGLHVLSPGEPFDQAEQYGSNVKKVMILMTDGDNFHKPNSNMNGSTFYPAYGYPYSNSTRSNAGRLGQPGWTENQLMAEMDARTLASCASAKAAGIEVFTIGLYSTTTATINMLKACSTTPTHYYPATAGNLTQVFQSIARQLQPLRLNQ